MEEESLSTLCQLIEAQLTLPGQGETGDQLSLTGKQTGTQHRNIGKEHRNKGTQHRNIGNGTHRNAGLNTGI